MATERVVIGLDGSDGARRAVDWVVQTWPAEVLVLAVHVLTFSHELVWDLTPETTTNWRARDSAPCSLGSRTWRSLPRRRLGTKP